jgi:aminomethyltransferase
MVTQRKSLNEVDAPGGDSPVPLPTATPQNRNRQPGDKNTPRLLGFDITRLLSKSSKREMRLTRYPGSVRFQTPSAFPLRISPVDSSELKKTPLNAIHRELGARMVDFAGWDMPVQYTGPIPEHIAVRTRAGMFDVSHMGEIELKGSTAEETIQKVTSNDVRRLAIGQCHYSALTTPSGTFVDDILVYRMGRLHFFLCVNSSNQHKDFEWIRDNAHPGTEVLFRSDDFAQIAVQGPRSAEILQPLTDVNLTSMKYYWFAEGKFAGAQAIVSRTGYTGEDGFEVYVSPEKAASTWQRIMESGSTYGLQPAGLAARNTLRLEAKMALYGHDIDDSTTVLEADLAWICRLDKGEFIGRGALLQQSRDGVPRLLVGFEMIERGIARDQCPVVLEGAQVGHVTSGSPAPFLQKNIGLTYLPTSRATVGTEFEVMVRGKSVKARVVATPFYKRPKTTA